MINIKKFLTSFAVLSFLAVSGFVLAQDAATDAQQDISLDEQVQAEDLDTKEPALLPDSPFYFLKNWTRGIQSVLTFGNEAKIELKQKFANEKLLEIRKLAEKTKNSKLVEKATENYQKEVEKIKNLAEKIQTKAETNPRINKFLDKYTQQQALHQKILQKLESQVPTAALEKIKQAREQHLEKFKDVMLKLEDKDKIPERLEKNLEALRGSEFKDLKNLEILKTIAEKMPKEIRIKIEEKRDNITEKLQARLENLSSSSQEKLKNYLEKNGGDKTKQLEILNKLQIQKIPEGIKNIIKKAGEETLNRISNEGEATREKAQKRINLAKDELAKAEAAIQKMAAADQKLQTAKKLLELAREHLRQANLALNEQKYGQAFGLATSAHNKALDIERMAERNVSTNSGQKPIPLANAKVEIKNFAFHPDKIIVKAGGAVTFVNQDATTHDISIDGTVVVPALQKGESGTYAVPAEKKTIEYICGLHPRMKGKIEIVTE